MPAGAWLETHVAATGEEAELFAELAGAIGRLARARPLTLHRSSDELPRPDGALDVVLPSGRIEATILPAAAAEAGERAGGDADRARLEKELLAAEGHLAAARARLANPEFTGKAPPAVVDGARRSEAELAEQVDRLRERLGR